METKKLKVTEVYEQFADEIFPGEQVRKMKGQFLGVHDDGEIENDYTNLVADLMIARASIEDPQGVYGFLEGTYPEDEKDVNGKIAKRIEGAWECLDETVEGFMKRFKALPLNPNLRSPVMIQLSTGKPVPQGTFILPKIATPVMKAVDITESDMEALRQATLNHLNEIIKGMHKDMDGDEVNTMSDGMLTLFNNYTAFTGYMINEEGELDEAYWVYFIPTTEKVCERMSFKGLRMCVIARQFAMDDMYELNGFKSREQSAEYFDAWHDLIKGLIEKSDELFSKFWSGEGSDE